MFTRFALFLSLVAHVTAVTRTKEETLADTKKGDINMEHFLTLSAYVKANPFVAGKSNYGVRQIFEVTGGWVAGDVSGDLVSPSADWMRLSDKGVGTLLVHTMIQTDDEEPAFIYVTYEGKVVFDDEAQAVLGDDKKPVVDFGAMQFYTSPTFETGDSRYEWLNAAVTVAEGRVFNRGDGTFEVQYRIYTPERVRRTRPQAKVEL